MAFIHFSSIRAKLLALFLVGGVLPIALVSLVAYFNSLKAVEEMVGNRTDRLAQEVGDELSLKLKRRLSDRILVENQPIQEFLSQDDAHSGPVPVSAYTDLQRYLKSLFDEYETYYSGLLVADDAGDPVFLYQPAELGGSMVMLPSRESSYGMGWVGANSDTLNAGAGTQIILGERLARTLEELGRKFETLRETAKADEARREAARLKAEAEAPPAPPGNAGRDSTISARMSRFLEKTLDAAGVDVDIQIPALDDLPTPPVPPKSVFDGSLAGAGGVSDSDRRAVGRGKDLKRGEVLVYTDRVKPGERACSGWSCRCTRWPAPTCAWARWWPT